MVKINTREYADMLMAKHAKTKKPTKSYSAPAPEHLKRLEERQKLHEMEALKRREHGAKKLREDKDRRRGRYAELQEELEECMAYRSEMGERVRPAMHDKPLLEKLVVENRANDRRIREIRVLLDELDRWK